MTANSRRRGGTSTPARNASGITETTIRKVVDRAKPGSPHHHDVMASHLRVFLGSLPAPATGGWTASLVRSALTAENLDAHDLWLAETGRGEKRRAGGRSSLTRIADALHGRTRRAPDRRPRSGAEVPLLRALADDVEGSFSELHACLRHLNAVGAVHATDLRHIPGMAPAASDCSSGTPWSPEPTSMTGLAQADAMPLREVKAMSQPVAEPRRSSKAAIMREAEAKRAARRAAEQIADLTRTTWPQWDALAGPVRQRLTRYMPRGLSAEQCATVLPAAVRLASLVAPTDAERASVVMSNLIPYLLWRAGRCGANADLPLELADVGGRRDVDQWLDVLRDQGARLGTLQTRRCEVRRAVDALRPDLAPTVLAYPPLQAPYGPREVRQLMSAARLQPDERMVLAMSVTVALCGGAGLRSGEAAAVRPVDVSRVELEDGSWTWLVDVGGEYPRRVPVMVAFRDLLTAALRRHGERRSATTPLLRESKRGTVSRAIATASSADGSPVGLSSQRLRNTWLTAQMQTPIPLATLLHAAGLGTTRSLGDLLPYCQPVSDERVAQLLAQAGEAGAES